MPVIAALRRLRQDDRDFRVHNQPILPPMVKKTNKIKELLLFLGHYFTAIQDGLLNLNLRFELLVLLDSECSAELG